MFIMYRYRHTLYIQRSVCLLCTVTDILLYIQGLYVYYVQVQRYSYTYRVSMFIMYRHTLIHTEVFVFFMYSYSHTPIHTGSVCLYCTGKDIYIQGQYVY